MKAGGLPVCGPRKAACRYKKEKRGDYLQEIFNGEGTSAFELERFDLHESLRSE